MKVSDHLIQILVEMGVEYIFGIPGSTTLEVLDSVYRINQIKFISVRHEQAAVGMADGYSRVTGKPGICLVHAGAGATNVITGVACAYRDSVPLLVITGNEEKSRLGREVLHEIDHLKLFKPITKLSLRLERESDLSNILIRAMKVFLSGRPGPVHLDLPMDLMKRDIDGVTPKKYLHLAPQVHKIDLDLVEKVRELVNQSSKPLFLAGEGVVWSSAERDLIDSAERFSIPVVTNDESRGCIPEDHPLFLGVAGKFGHRSANSAMEETDLLIALGSRMDDVTTLNWSLPKRGTKIVQVYPNRKEIGRQVPVDVGIIGSVKGFLKVLLGNSNISYKTCWYADQIQKVRMADQEHFMGSKVESFLINPYNIISDLSSVIEADAILAVGSGLHTLFTTKFVIRQSRSFIRSVGLGGMGFAFPAAMGAKLAYPKRQVVLLIGDGDFFITLPDLETAVKLGISFLIIIFNNGSYGALRFRQMANYEGRYIGVDFKNPDFAQLATIFGARGRRIEEPGSLRSAIEEGMRSDSPYIIDAVIDPHALPEDMSHFKIQ